MLQISVNICLLHFQDTVHKAKEKEKGKSPNPVRDLMDLILVVKINFFKE